ncbi:right-handed parallel beta-helix repeat-containing protein [Clostridium sp. AL.422]|uniref:right-handed parallel beta-helix repeat-containing protein n=1 Tax=Clostridium TaxID=1485 RepID=UPI00293DBDCD|nr:MULTISPECIES: right-handed parallel beta-helix repeat-containing protein [unclassified Clostridium]MDV4152007.1 right-handed parallel beta-helix repeat-containing protein [Clostridium sp. AL.422]
MKYRNNSHRKYLTNSLFTFLTALLLLFVSYHSFKNIFFKADYIYYISEDGSDDNDGSKSSPLRSLYGFKKLLIQNIKDNEITKGSIKVHLGNGTYKISKSFKLTNKDLLDKDIYIEFIGENKDKVFLTGGITLDNKKLEEVNNTSNLSDKKVYSYDLSKENISFNLKNNSIDNAPEIFSGDKALNIARYPNDNFILTGSINNKKSLTGHEQYSFNIEEKLPKNFNYNNAYVSGYWYHDWSDSTAKIQSVKNNKLTIKGHLPYGIEENQRFYIFNVFEALDKENEYYIDYDNKKLFIIPEDNDKNSEIKLSLISEPLINLEGLSNISFKNITFENTTNHGILIENSSNIKIENCIIRNLSKYGIYMNNVSNSKVNKNEIYNTGTGGVFASGGDRITLTSSNIKIGKNEIYNFSRIKKTYSAAINIEGVGITASNNKIYDGPHTGILFGGNDHVIEKNEIFDVAKETNDVGAIYSGRNWTYRGNIIRKNYIHDLSNDSLGQTVVGIYLDDCLSSAHVYKNRIENVPLAILAGGGRDNIIEENIIIDCLKSITFDDRGLYGTNYESLVMKLGDVPYNSETWIEKYPEIESLNTIDPKIPYGNIIINNKLKNTSEMTIKAAVLEYGTVVN